MNDDISKFILSLAIAAIVAIGVLVTYISYVVEPEQLIKHQQLYSTWCKAENRTDLTYDEWYSLYLAKLLPRQTINQK